MILIVSLAAFVLGLAVGFYLRARSSKSAETVAAEMADRLYEAHEQQRQTEFASIVGNVTAMLETAKQGFGGVAFDALAKNTEQFLALAGERLGAERAASAQDLEAKRGLIGQQLGAIADGMTTKLGEVTALVKTLEGDRRQTLGEVSQQLQSAGEQIVQLSTVTTSLREALRSTKQRGQWGERMAEDVLRAYGFIEGVNYLKQATLIDGARPDFTFLLPKDRSLNMDVKFPLDNYLRMLDAQGEMEQVRYKKDFLKDVRLRMKEITGRAYIDAQQGTCDCVAMFIPNEGLCSFIHSEDAQLIDEALKNHVVMCSPLTLFSVLAVIRPAVDQFAMERTSNEILSLVGAFHKQWGAFVEQMNKVGKRIEDSATEFDALIGTRKRMLERPLGKIEDLRAQRQLPVADDLALGA